MSITPTRCSWSVTQRQDAGLQGGAAEPSFWKHTFGHVPSWQWHWVGQDPKAWAWPPGLRALVPAHRPRLTTIPLTRAPTSNKYACFSPSPGLCTRCPTFPGLRTRSVPRVSAKTPLPRPPSHGAQPPAFTAQGTAILGGACCTATRAWTAGPQGLAPSRCGLDGGMNLR